MKSLSNHGVLRKSPALLDVLMKLLERERTLRRFGRVDRQPENVGLAFAIEVPLEA